MHLAHTVPYVGHRLSPVEHRRQFDEHQFPLFEQQVAQLCHVRRAVGYGKGSSTVAVASCRVDENHRLPLHRLQHLFGLCVHHRSVPVHVHHLQVVPGDVAQRTVALHIASPFKPFGHEGEIHSESPRQVSQRCRLAPVCQPLSQCRLVGGGTFRRALFHRQVRRIHHTRCGRPLRQFGLGPLPSVNLRERKVHVHVVVVSGRQCQFFCVIIPVQGNKFFCCHVICFWWKFLQPPYLFAKIRHFIFVCA